MDRSNLIIWIFAFLLVIDIVNATEIRGTITDENGNPLIGAFAILEYNGVKRGAVADENGNFRIAGVNPGSYTVTFSYLNIEQSLLVNANEEINVQFEQTIFEVPEIIIEAQRPNLLPVIEAKPFIPEEYLFSDYTVYGNSEISSQEPIPIYPGNYLVLDGSKSQFDSSPLEEIYMTWYIGIPSFEFEQLLTNVDEFFYENLNNLLNDHRSFNPGYYVRRTSQLNIQLSREDFSFGDYYVVLKVTNPLDSFDEQYTWHKINIDFSNRDYCSRGGCDEELIFDGGIDDLEITWPPTEEPLTTPFNPSDFPTIDQPQPPGTRAYNGYWVPLQVSAWSCQETDFPTTNPAYNNPTISSTCRSGTVIQRDTCGCLDPDAIFTTDCLQGFTHVTEYSCSNNCAVPRAVQCPQGMQCIMERDGGACKSPNFKDLEDIPELEFGLLQPPLEFSEEIIISLTDNDLINSALCNSLGLDISSLEVVEPPAPTASVIKQITGFFSKITGRQAAAPLRRYTTTIDTSGYSELANLEFPYYTFADNRKARFLDRNIGSALLKNFGYTNQIIETALLSSQPYYREGNSGATLLKLGNSYVFSPTAMLYERILDESRRKATENIGSQQDIISALNILFDSRNPNDYAGLRFLLVQTTGNKFLKIDNSIFSVSRGLYLIPYPFNENVNYELVSDPTQDPELKPYYDLAFNIPAVSYVIGPEEYINIKFLTPSEGYYTLRDVPITPELETVEKSFVYTPKKGEETQYRANLNYRIIPINDLPAGKDYGDFKKGLYFIPEKNIIIMDNEYETSRALRKKIGANLEAPAAGNRLVYYFEFFNAVRDSLRQMEEDEYRNSLRGWFEIGVVRPIINTFKGPRLPYSKIFTG